MSIELLNHVEQLAAHKMGWSAEEYHRVQESRIPQQYDIGPLDVRPGLQPQAVVTHVGQNLTMFKGGCGFRAGDLYPYGGELGRRMWTKNFLAGLINPINGMPVGGNKILIGANAEDVTFDDTLRIFQLLPEALHKKKILFKTYTAGDMGTNDPRFMDAFVEDRRRVAEKYSIEDLFWRAGATGTSQAYGGLPYRESSTGDGVADAARHARKVYEQKYGYSKEVMDVTTMGMGAVGAWANESLNREPGRYRSAAFSDMWSRTKSGLLYVRNLKPGMPGIEIDEDIVRNVLDNPAFKDDPVYKGNKLKAVADIVSRRQPYLDLDIKLDADIVTYPTDIFIPAAGKDAIHIGNVRRLAASILAFGANGPETKEAYEYLTSAEGIREMADRQNSGPVVMQRSDPEANIRGVDVSMIEVESKCAIARNQAPIDNEDAIARAKQNGEKLFHSVDAAAEYLDTDEHVGAAAISLTRAAMHLGGITIDPKMRELVAA